MNNYTTTVKYPRTYHFPFSPGTTSDDRIHKNWRILLQNEIVMTEKLDGENTCLKTSGVYARSHAAPTRNPWAKNMWSIWQRVKNDLHTLEIFGENLYGIHSIEYQNLEHYFYIFGIRDGSKWLSWEDVCFYAALLDIPTVPILAQGKFTDIQIEPIIQQFLAEGSKLQGECEGFVFRSAPVFYDFEFKHKVIKYVRANHVKTDEHWTRNWKRAKLYFEKAV